MKQKRLGILGGMGPKATAVFLDMIIDKTVAEKDQDHIDTVVLSHATLPDRTQSILTRQEQVFLQAIQPDFQLFEQAGVDHIAIPCNTSHYFFTQLQEMTSIPLLNMVEETARRIKERYGTGIRVGILATEGTLQTKVYERACEKQGLNPHVPDAGLRKKVMEIIYDQVKNRLDLSPEALEAVVGQLVEEEHCSCVILACTELSCITLAPERARYCVDAMAVLAETAIERSGKQVKA